MQATTSSTAKLSLSSHARTAPLPSRRARHAPFVVSAVATSPQNRSNSRREALQSLVAGIALVSSRPSSAANEADARLGEIRHSDAEWRQLLAPDQYAVLRTAATERRYSSPLVEEHRKGTFLCAGCGSPVFPSSAKYESGTGWPSFVDVLPGAVIETSDNSVLFMPRTEVRCAKCQGHLGHVFPDGPPPTGLRYCMNGVAMTFKPEEA